MGVITKEGLDQLDRYEYKSGSWTVLDQFFNHWWNFAVEFLPLSMAPNVVTLTGLMFLVLQCLVFVYYCPNLTEACPSWVYFLSAFCQFMYQTLDAIDGKQARRTKASSPLGQLFDHGCDSVGTLLCTLPAVMTTRLGASPLSLGILLAIQGPFFLAQWEESHTHSFRTNIGLIFGVTEGQLMEMMLLIIAGVMGGDFWSTPVWGDMTRVHFIVYFLLASNSYIMSQNIWTVLKTVQGSKKLQAAIELIPLLTLMTCGFFWHTTRVYQQYPCACFFVLGAIFSHLTSQMIVCSLTHMKYTIWQFTLVPLPLIVLNSFLPKIAPAAFPRSPVPENPLVFVYLVFVLLIMGWYIHGVISQITVHLGIYCLSLEKRPDFEEKFARRQRILDGIKAERERKAAAAAGSSTTSSSTTTPGFPSPTASATSKKDK